MLLGKCSRCAYRFSVLVVGVEEKAVVGHGKSVGKMDVGDFVPEELLEDL